MINIEISKSNGSNQVLIDGEAIIDNIALIKSKIDPLLEEGGLIINIDQVKNADLSFIQLLYCLAVEYKKRNKKLSVICGNPDNMVIKTAYKLGFSNQALLSSLLNLNEE